MKRIVLSIILALATINSNAYTPIVYINGQPHNAGLAYGITALQDFMDHKSDEFSPSLQLISSTILAQQNDDLNYGASVSALTYNQKLDGLLKGLFFQTTVPIVVVSNKIDALFVNTSSINDLTMLIQNTGVADITLLFGYKIFDQAAYKTAFNIDLILPVQQKKLAKEQLIPSIGNGGHIALGTSIDGNVRVVGDDNHNLTLAAEAQYHYLFDAERQLLLGLNRTTKPLVNQVLLGHATQIIPTYAATTSHVTVLPGSNIDIAASFIYNYHKFFVNLGCSYHLKTETKLDHIDDAILKQKFDKFQLNGKKISLKNIDLNTQSATIPESHLLNINGTIGFVCKEWILPILEIPYAYNLSLSGTVTALHSNDVATWDLSMKSGISF